MEKHPVPIPISASDLAGLLLEEMISTQRIDPRHLKIDDDARARFEEKAWLYQAAGVLMAITSLEDKRKEYSTVKVEVESLIFQPRPTPNALHLVASLRAAMKNLYDLLFPVNPRAYMSWSRAWLLDINIDESNPANLALFAMQCTSFYTTVTECLGQFKVEA